MLSANLEQTLHRALAGANERRHEYATLEHLLLALIDDSDAVSVLRARGLSDRIKVLADYYTHAVYRGIKRDKILAAPTDFPALQGRLGIEMAVRVLEDRLEHVHAGPLIKLVDAETLQAIGSRQSLAPASFSPTFVVE